MRTIVWLTPPAHGHVNPTLPVVRELVRRGERVVCWNTEEFRPRIERTGAEFRPYAASDLSSATLSRLVEDGNLVNVTVLILRATDQILPALLEELPREAPDLILFDSIALWGKMAAARLNVRAAGSIALLLMDRRLMTTRDLLRALRQALPLLPALIRGRRRLVRRFGSAFPSGRPLFPMRDRLNIVFTARGLQLDTPLIDESFRFVGPSIDPATRDEDFPFDALGNDRVVYISMGTVHDAQPAFVRACFEAFGGHSARFVMAVGPRTSVESLGPAPANFIVRQSVPQLGVLDRAEVFITHAGINSVQEALYFGVPQVLIPHQFEQLVNARRVAALGAGVLLEVKMSRKPVTAAMLRRALHDVTSSPRYRESARRLQASVRATGGYRQAADEIQAYIQ